MQRIREAVLVRLAPEIKARIRADASSNKRSMGSELEYRIEQLYQSSPPIEEHACDAHSA
jgi:hypothetical protein